MNLGDGLLFELENGKPKLILLQRGAEQGPAKPLSSKPRAANILTPRQPSCLDDVQVERPAGQQAGKHQDVRDKARAGSTPFPSRTTADSGRVSTTTASKTREHHIAVGGTTKAPTKGKPERLKHSLRANGQIQNSGKNAGGKVALKDTHVGGDVALKDSMVCLTSEQLQQILASVQSSRDDRRTSEDHKIQGSERKESESGYSENEGGSGEMKEGGGGGGGGGVEDIQNGHVTDMTGLSQDKNNRRELHNSRSAGLFSWLEERHSDSRAAMDAKKAQWRRELNEQVALKQQQHLETGRLQGEEDTGSVLSVHSSLSHRDQPAAIRSSLKLGEFIPMEELLSAEKQEEEKRRWLEELDQQREEATERRKQEKLLQNQAEDHELWATHFDSLQRRPPTRAAAPSAPPPGPLCGSERREWEPSSSLSMAWDTASSCEAESVGGASVDMANRYPARNGYLRTMTALLDPVQIEERERRRVKQLDHQKALLAQIEDRRQQKEQEEEKRRLEQEEEERRLELEREKMVKQYKIDAQMDRRKDEQEKNEEGKLPETQQPSVASRLTECLPEKIDNIDAPHKHIAVQTEIAPAVQLGTEKLQSPEVSANHQPAPAPPLAPLNRGTRAGRTGKENICLSGGGGDGEAGGGGGGDPYEAFARTNRNRKEKKKPEWNSQRPTRQFVPASKRYPAPLQKNRRESREKRKAELLALQERSCVRSDPPPHPPPQTKTTPRKVESVARNQTNSATINPERGHSPPVPAVRHRVQSQQDSPASPPPPTPPILELVPFIRTEEVLNLDPVESTNGPLPHTAPPQSSASSPANSHRDVLLHPELLRNTRTPRQQEILRGLAQLRQGLLQKQKELEMDLYP